MARQTGPIADETADGGEATVTGDDGRDRSTYPDRGGIDVFDSLLVRQPIRAGETAAVRDLLATWTGDHADGDVRTLLPVDGVTLVTLFLDDGDFGWSGDGGDASAADPERGDALVWYVEVVDDHADPWQTPDATIRSASPLFEAGLDDYLADGATVHADGRDGHRLITHATHPDRQDRYVGAVGPSLVAPVAGDDLPIPVALTTVALKPGLTSTLVARVVDFGNWLKGSARVQAWLRDETDTLEEEAMYTESLLLEPVGDRLVMHYYMEAEDMDRLYDAYATSDNWEVRFSDWVMRRIFVDPDEVLDPPLESDCEVLIHAVDPQRP